MVLGKWPMVIGGWWYREIFSDLEFYCWLLAKIQYKELFMEKYYNQLHILFFNHILNI